MEDGSRLPLMRLISWIGMLPALGARSRPEIPASMACVTSLITMAE
jgi:hypothetical protein